MRRMPGTGSIYERTKTRPDGTPYTRWVVQVSKGGRENRRIYRRTFASFAQAQAAINDPASVFPLPHEELAPPIVRRFYSHVEREGHPNGCWEWTASRYPSGYGHFTIDKDHSQFAHRFALSMELGRPLALTEYACHKCDNKTCVRVAPDHVYLGDARTNAADRTASNRRKAA